MRNEMILLQMQERACTFAFAFYITLKGSLGLNLIPSQSQCKRDSNQIIKLWAKIMRNVLHVLA